MEKILKGYIKHESCGLAGKRLKECSSVLTKYGISFPPLYAGTINIRLDEPFLTPSWSSVIYIPQKEIDAVAPGYGEWWKFIPVKKINSLPIEGFIYRNRQHVHGDNGAELLTVDLRNNVAFNLVPGAEFNLTLLY